MTVITNGKPHSVLVEVAGRWCAPNVGVPISTDLIEEDRQDLAGERPHREEVVVAVVPETTVWASKNKNKATIQRHSRWAAE